MHKGSTIYLAPAINYSRQKTAHSPADVNYGFASMAVGYNTFTEGIGSAKS